MPKIIDSLDLIDYEAKRRAQIIQIGTAIGRLVFKPESAINFQVGNQRLNQEECNILLEAIRKNLPFLHNPFSAVKED